MLTPLFESPLVELAKHRHHPPSSSWWQLVRFQSLLFIENASAELRLYRTMMDEQQSKIDMGSDGWR